MSLTLDRQQQTTDRTTHSARPGLPLIVMAGASGKTSTGWRLVDLFEQAGVEAVAWLTDGVYIGGALRRDELHAWELATLAARAREVDALIQEVPSVLASNLPPRSVRVALLTAICGSDDQCRRDAGSERELGAVHSVIEALQPHGEIVATADDYMVVDAASNSGRPTTYFALNGANPVLRSHINAGGNAVWAQNGWVKAQIDGIRERIARVEELPGTLAGHVIYQVQNALGALAAAVAFGLPAGALAAGIHVAQRPSPQLANSGTTVSESDGRILVHDHPASLTALRQLVRGIRAYGPLRTVQRIGSLERFSGSELPEVARTLGSLGGIAILARDELNDIRLEQLRTGLMQSDNPPAIVVKDRHAASEEQIEALLEPGDVGLFIDGP